MRGRAGRGAAGFLAAVTAAFVFLGGPGGLRAQGAPTPTLSPGPAVPGAPVVPVLPWGAVGLPSGGGAEASGSAVFQDAAVTPRGAFLRSLVLPGWGHVAAGAHGRAAFYVAAQGGSGWMLAKSLERRRSANRFRASEMRLVEDEIRAAGVSRPDSVRLLAMADPRVERWEELVEVRSDQVEDWIALSVFLALLGATDALVAAHMADTPEPLSIRILPEGRGGGWSLTLSLPWGGRGGGGP